MLDLPKKNLHVVVLVLIGVSILLLYIIHDYTLRSPQYRKSVGGFEKCGGGGFIKNYKKNHYYYYYQIS